MPPLERHPTPIYRILRLSLLAVVLSIPSTEVDAQQPAQSIDSVRWLAGCWSRTDASGETVERWSLPEAQGMFGWSRRIRGDSLMTYEMLVMSAVRGRLVYIAHVPGQTPTVFPATAVDDTLVVFENPQHDFPTEIRYRRVGHDSLRASIAVGEGPDRREIPLPFARVPCTALPPG